ncbi:MAG: DinB family protein [Amphritea sp.]
MTFRDHFLLMADYNQRMNNQLFEAAGKLSTEELCADRGTFFSSVLGTLNHILVGDLIWLARFATHSDRYRSLADLSELPKPEGLNDVIYPKLSALRNARREVDWSIKCWLADEVQDTDFSKSLAYASTKGVESERNFGELVCHLFNHQTHHRGQVTTLLNQQGIDVGITDFLIDIPDLKV